MMVSISEFDSVKICSICVSIDETLTPCMTNPTREMCSSKWEAQTLPRIAYPLGEPEAQDLCFRNAMSSSERS
jgi:hypothetical protein